MAHSRCPFLLLEYIGQFSAAICKCTDNEKCYNKRSPCQIVAKCFHLEQLRKRPEGFAIFGNGKPDIPEKPAGAT